MSVVKKPYIKVDPDPKKKFERWISELLQLIGVATNRNIFSAATELAWPIPPEPELDGPFLRWRTGRSVVSWPDDLLNALRQYGGVDKAQQAVLACRSQAEVDRLHLLMQEVVDGIRPNEDAIKQALYDAEEKFGV